MKYPNAIKKATCKTIDYANRGMDLESDLNLTNTYYIENDLAIIHKKPTPIKIVKVSFDNRKHATIKEAYFGLPSTTDYNGIYKGRYVDFEAKEVRLKSFPLSNINAHQIEHMRKVINHGGISFIIVRFTTLCKNFLFKGEDLIDYIDNVKAKSIPIAVFEEKGYLIKEAFMPRLNYIDIIDIAYLGGKV